mgnify:CR=1 FL=1
MQSPHVPTSAILFIIGSTLCFSLLDSIVKYLAAQYPSRIAGVGALDAFRRWRRRCWLAHADEAQSHSNAAAEGASGARGSSSSARRCCS